MNASSAGQAALSNDLPDDGAVSTLLDDVRAGLLEPPRSMPPKYFYDERGSILFDQICDTPEYYPTRTESALLAEHASAIMDGTRPSHLVELGSGASRKTRHLLRAWNVTGRTYWPLDVSEEMLVNSAEQLRADFPGLQVNVVVADYGAGLAQLPDFSDRRLFAFLGSTIGNFPRAAAAEFLSEVAMHMSPGDHLLLGLDRVKDPRVLHAAYNDAQGLTAAFNLNLLTVLNREAGADFDRRNFSHLALYNESLEQIEMYLESTRDQTVSIDGINAKFDLMAGEKILTEISRKFTPASVETLMDEAGLVVAEHFEPANEYFSLVLAQVKD